MGDLSRSEGMQNISFGMMLESDLIGMAMIGDFAVKLPCLPKRMWQASIGFCKV